MRRLLIAAASALAVFALAPSESAAQDRGRGNDQRQDRGGHGGGARSEGSSSRGGNWRSPQSAQQSSFTRQREPSNPSQIQIQDNGRSQTAQQSGQSRWNSAENRGDAPYRGVPQTAGNARLVQSPSYNSVRSAEIRTEQQANRRQSWSSGDARGQAGYRPEQQANRTPTYNTYRDDPQHNTPSQTFSQSYRSAPRPVRAAAASNNHESARNDHYGGARNTSGHSNYANHNTDNGNHAHSYSSGNGHNTSHYGVYRGYNANHHYNDHRHDDNRYHPYAHTHRDFHAPRYSHWRHVPHGRYFEGGYVTIVHNYYGWNYRWWSYPGWRRPYRYYQVGFVLPPHIYWSPVPYDLYYRLPPAPYGCRYVLVERDILLITIATGVIIDALVYY